MFRYVFALFDCRYPPGYSSSFASFGFLVVFFFFQAEDGIRDADVTGVQTCALPILHHASRDEPQYIIKSDKTDHVAIHKGRVLKHLTAQTERRSRKPNPKRKARR